MKQRKRRRKPPRKLGICYLCGEPLNGNVNKDHIPPRQLFSHPDRKKQNLNQLETRYTHESCNKLYQEDEKYFTDWMSIISHEINPISDVLRRNEQAKKEGTAKRKFIKEVEEAAKAPIYSSEGYVLMIPKEPESIDRAIWKIIRGLYFIEHKNKIVLPMNTKHDIGRPIAVRNQRTVVPSTFTPEELRLINELLIRLKHYPSKGKYPEVFDYKYDSDVVLQKPQLRKYVWVLILQKSIHIVVKFKAH